MHFAGFTDKEKRLLEVLKTLVDEGVRENWDERAAAHLDCAPTTVRTRLCRLRVKYGDAKMFCKEFRSWQQRLYQKSGGKFTGLNT